MSWGPATPAPSTLPLSTLALPTLAQLTSVLPNAAHITVLFIPAPVTTTVFIPGDFMLEDLTAARLTWAHVTRVRQATAPWIISCSKGKAVVGVGVI